jgi:dTDP-4-dehydrorhamnose reductase
MKVLLTGRNGQLGRTLELRLRTIVDVTATARAQLDLDDDSAIREAMRSVRPDLVINAAAFTVVDLAEKDHELAHSVNARAPGVIAREAAAVGAGIVHYSTDYVFDGRKAGGYCEDDETGPLNAYGRTKLAGEIALREAGAGHAILRVSWLYGGRYGNFLSTMMRLLRERTEVSVVDDQIGCPTWRGAVADATCQLVLKMRDSGRTAADFLNEHGGVFHAAGPGSTSWFGFARTIADEMRRRDESPARVLPVPSAEYPRPAPRPPFSILLNRRLRERFGIGLPPWREQLTACLDSQDRLASAA